MPSNSTPPTPAAALERRTLSMSTQRIEVRAAEGSPATLIGYASVFNSATDIGWFDEQVQPGAFARSLAEGDDIRALFNHDIDQIIGRRSAGTLRLSEDATGLRVEIDLPDTTVARDLAANIAVGNIDGMSFGFRVREESWELGDEKTGQRDLRKLLDVELVEVSAVTFPAYPDTSIAKRSREHAAAPQNQSQTGHDAAGESRNVKPQPSLEVLRLRAARRKSKIT